MPAPITVVIPTLNAAAELPGSLGALMEGLSEGLIREVVISDGGSTDVTLDLAEEAGAELVTGAPSRGGQLRRGCAVARGEWILVLHADTQLAPGWAAVVAVHIREGQGATDQGSPAYFQLKFRAKGVAASLVAGWANLRARVFGLPYGDQGLLMPRAAYLAAGAYPDQPLMEDVALVRCLKTLTPLPVTALTSAARYQRDGWLRRGAGNLWTLLRYFLGAEPQKLAREYHK